MITNQLIRNTWLIISGLAVSVSCLANPAEQTMNHCGNHKQAEQLIKLIQAHQGQQRQQLHCNNQLNEIAQIKANYIIRNQNIWHDAGNLTPNQLLRHNGFKLPQGYALFGNQVEALAGGINSATEVFTDFLGSEPHRKLLLGEEDLFRQQDQIGVAYIKDLSTDHQHYWVVLIAGQQPTSNTSQTTFTYQAAVPKKKKRSRGREIKNRIRSHHAKRQGGFELIK